MLKIKTKKRISIFFIVLFLLQMLPFPYLYELAYKAQAADGSASVDAWISYDMGKGQVVEGATTNTLYYQDSSLTTTITPSTGGQPVKSVKVRYPGSLTDVSVPFTNKGGGDYDITLSGVNESVSAPGNNSLKGYWAWYRYSPGGTKGESWYATLTSSDGVSYEVEAGFSKISPGPFATSTASSESVNGYSMPAWPGVDSSSYYTLKLAAQKNQKYKTAGGLAIDDVAVGNVSATNPSVNLNAGTIPGPSGTSGRVVPQRITPKEARPISPNNSKNFEVLLDYNFEEPVGGSDSIQPLGAPGASLMVYYYAMSVDLQGTTYKYPTKVTVTYDPPATADLVPVSISPGASCVAVNASTSLNFSIRNAGGASSGASTAKVTFNGSSGTTTDTINVGALAAGQTTWGTLSKTFTSSGAHNITFKVDSDGVIAEGSSGEGNNQFSTSVLVEASCGGPSGGLDGDFEILPGTINWRDSFTLKPKPFKIPPGCTYEWHNYRFKRGSVFSYSPNITSQSQSTTISYSQYPSALSIGMNDISIKIKADCGTTDYIKEKPLEIIGSPNEPPVFQAAWFEEGEKEITRENEVNWLVIGEEYDLAIVKEPNADPNKELPRDPDGDMPLYYTWHFQSSDSPFIRSLHSKFLGSVDRERYKSIKVPDDESLVNTLQRVVVTARDSGNPPASTDRTVDIFIVRPNPVADCDGIVSVKSRRTFVNTFDTSDSFSPLDRAVRVSHWEGIETPFINDTDSPITKHIYVWVVDSAGLMSEDSAKCDVQVLPDKPPIGQTSVPSVAIRGEALNIFNQSYSIDGDVIASVQYRYKYDADNDGNFDEEAWTNVPGTLEKAVFTPNKVGKYLFDVIATEDYGKTSVVTNPAQNLRILDVRNNGPEVSFKVIGENNQPQLENATYYPATDILNTWSHVRTGTGAAITESAKLNRWKVDNGKLVAMWGSDLHNGNVPIEYDITSSGSPSYDRIIAPIDSGYGHNRLTPYRAPKGNTTANYLINDNFDVNVWIGANYVVSKTHLYFIEEGSSYSADRIVAVNKNDMKSQSTYKHEWTITGNRSPYEVNDDGYIYTAYKYQKFSKLVLVEDELWAFTYGLDNGYEAEAYDPMSGAFLRSVDIPAINNQSVSQNVHVLTGKGEIVLENNDGLIKINKYGQELGRFYTDQNGLPAKSSGSCDVSTYFPVHTGDNYRDTGNNLYRYEYRGSCPEANFLYPPQYYASVVKINLDTMSYVWRTDLKYDRTYSQKTSNLNRYKVQQNPVLFVNAPLNVIYAKSFSDTDFDPVSVQTLDANTGAILNTQDWGSVPSWWFWENPFNFGMDWSGNLINAAGSSGLSADGKYVNQFAGFIANPDGSQYGNITIPTPPKSGSKSVKNMTVTKGELIGDGLFLYKLEWDYGSFLQSSYAVSYGAPSTTEPLVIEPFYLGQFISPSTYGDMEYGVTLNMRGVAYDSQLAGLSFRMQDIGNRYAVETDGTTAYLTKYVGGVRTVLVSIPYPFEDWKDYTIRVTAQANVLNVWINGVPFFSDVVDNTFASGKFGPFTEKPLVHFAKVYTKEPPGMIKSLIPNYAIWESGSATAKVEYRDITFTDPENDPRAGTYSWSYAHTPKFIANQGISAYNGNTYPNGVLNFDKIGEYIINLAANDDPHLNYLHPSMVFDAYRKKSNPFAQKMVVHRRPVASATVSQNATTGVVSWTDASYDPDRWVNSTTYSGPETPGMNYGVDRGIKQWRYFYITPSGSTVEAKLTHPTEIGTYEVHLQVMDEYGALSYPWSGVVQSLVLPPPNAPPGATLTFPSGTQASPSSVTTQPTMVWNQWDADAGTVFTAFDLMIKDEDGTVVPGQNVTDQGMNTTLGSWSWTVDSPLQAGRIYQVQVRVSDGQAWSAWSNIGWMITNSPPTAVMTNPWGTHASPTIFSTLRPTLQWSQTDPDPGTTFTYFQAQITNEANNGMILDSGQYWQGNSSSAGSWNVPANLPAGQKLRARVRVFDGIVWSSYSAQTWMFINRVPVAAFDWTPKPVWEGDTVALLDQSTDPDGDALTYAWRVVKPDSSIVLFTARPASIVFDQVGDYRVSLTVSDGRAATSVSRTITANPLTIASEVLHTPLWLEQHEKAGHNTVQVPKDFYSGEILVVGTRSSPAPVSEVKAWLDTTGIDGGSLYLSVDLSVDDNDAALFHGELFDLKLQSMTEGLPVGLLTIHFQVRYGNGVIKTEDVPVNIIGNVLKSVGVHRVQ